MHFPRAFAPASSLPALLRKVGAKKRIQTRKKVRNYAAWQALFIYLFKIVQTVFNCSSTAELIVLSCSINNIFKWMNCDFWWLCPNEGLILCNRVDWQKGQRLVITPWAAAVFVLERNSNALSPFIAAAAAALHKCLPAAKFIGHVTCFRCLTWLHHQNNMGGCGFPLPCCPASTADRIWSH